MSNQEIILALIDLLSSFNTLLNLLRAIGFTIIIITLVNSCVYTHENVLD